MVKNKIYICLVLLITAILPSSVNAQSEISKVVYSKAVKDSFLLKINLPTDYYNSDKDFKLLVYLDANLKSGNKIRTLYSGDKLINFSQNFILVGIGHIGNYNIKRRRDFIPSNPEGNKLNQNKDFAHADSFYSFLVSQLIPSVKSQYRTSDKGSLLCGHSFGGGFTLYAMQKSTSPFSSYISLSPSIWANNKSILKYDFQTTYISNRNLILTSGGLEIFNRIYFNTKRFNNSLNQSVLKPKSTEFKTYPFHTHNSYVKRGLFDCLKTFTN